MSVLQILVLVGVIGGFVLLLVALRGSFKDDDAFYDGSTLGDGRPTNNPAPAADSSEGAATDAGDDGSDRGLG